VLGDSVVAGHLIADVRTIQVTDIPATDPVPRARLRDHLLSDDFFAATRYPTARFDLTSVRRENNRLYRADGRLTMRDRTHPISLYARGWAVQRDSIHAEASVTLDRQDWGISYQGSTIRDDLVDDKFTLELVVYAVRPLKEAN
jgi:polyisoprenoid-binding protein YceI